MSRHLWSTIAYCARYGNQPLSELMALSMLDLRTLQAALSDIVKQENGSKE